MKEIVNNFLLSEDEFMPEIHLRQSGFTYRACRVFTKNKQECKNFKKQEIPDIFIKMNQDKACFPHDMAYGDFKNLTRRIASDKILREKAASNIAKI